MSGKLLNSVRIKTNKPLLTWTDVWSEALATMTYGTVKWAARTCVVVVTLKLWGIA